MCFRRRVLQVKLSLNVFMSLLQASLSQKGGILPSVATSSLQLWMNRRRMEYHTFSRTHSIDLYTTLLAMNMINSTAERY